VQVELAGAPYADEDVPTAQVMHVAAELAPDVGEYVPGAQAVQVVYDEAPTWVEYVPGEHCARREAGSVGKRKAKSSAVGPERKQKNESNTADINHAQSNQLTGVQAAAPALEYVPAGQARHAATEIAPKLFELVPARHSVHDPAPEAEYVPVPHCVHVVAPAAEYDPAGQDAHVVALAAYVPAVHAAHAAAPPADVLPASHGVHVAAPAAAA
jgi:hypothetical protein